jgi:beta-N-acetylhexosaminidase
MRRPGGRIDPVGGGHQVSHPILGRVMLAFEGAELPERVAARLAEAPAAGVTLFRHLNVRSPAQVRELTAAVQRAGAAAGTAGPPLPGPLLMAADQECGQFIALGDGSTPFAGNMALGAVDDVDLTERVGRAIGLEARAMGVNVVYAPVLDVATNPLNPALGIRAFSDDPAFVARHGAAMVRGLQSAGVAATVKHAPGAGEAATDPHHGGATVPAGREVLEGREFVPFRAAFAAGVRMAMSGHFALPAVTGRDDLPTTLSRAVMTDLLRRDLGFEGVTISDALDMRALAQGPDQAVDVVAAIRAGVDLLLASADPEALARIEHTLVWAADRELFDTDEVAATEHRVGALRAWLASPAPGADPDLAVVGGAEHQALAGELAARSITLIADPNGTIPLRAATPGRILAIMPRPSDLTPADTSSTVAPALGAALRRYHADVDEVVVEPEPDAASIAAVRDRAAAAGHAVVGTIDAHRLTAQLRLVEAVAASGTPTIAVAMRGPWDVAAYPAGVTSLATYSILPGSLDALAAVLSGEASAVGRVPVRLPVPA